MEYHLCGRKKGGEGKKREENKKGIEIRDRRETKNDVDKESRELEA